MLDTGLDRTINPVYFSIPLMIQCEEIILEANIFQSFPTFPWVHL